MVQRRNQLGCQKSGHHIHMKKGWDVFFEKECAILLDNSVHVGLVELFLLGMTKVTLPTKVIHYKLYKIVKS